MKFKKRVGQGIQAANSNWTFKGKVANTFDSHINKSVPFYKEGHQLINQVSDFFIKEDSICYEIGCSTGTIIKSLGNRHKNKKKSKFIGIDLEKDMIKFAKKTNKVKNVKLEHANALKYKFKKSDLIISYYTMQFIRPRERQKLFNMIFKSLNWGGAFIMFEKVRARDARFQDLTVALYNEYKLNNGFSPTEIFNKTRSLKGVLEPFSSRGNSELLDRAGFKDYMNIFKYVCFSGFLAIK